MFYKIINEDESTALLHVYCDEMTFYHSFYKSLSKRTKDAGSIYKHALDILFEEKYFKRFEGRIYGKAWFEYPKFGDHDLVCIEYRSEPFKSFFKEFSIQIVNGVKHIIEEQSHNVTYHEGSEFSYKTDSFNPLESVMKSGRLIMYLKTFKDENPLDCNIHEAKLEFEYNDRDKEIAEERQAAEDNFLMFSTDIDDTEKNFVYLGEFY